MVGRRGGSAGAAPAGPGREAWRTGLGRDRHPFGPDEPLRLGGIELLGAPRLHGHSDGDVVLHAVADALLGAAALGDLGRLAPADARTPRGVPSRDLLRVAVSELAQAGWRPAGVDLIIVGARPRLADHLEAIRTHIAALLSLPSERVSVKASSGNLQGPEGEGRAIAAEALATIEPLDGQLATPGHRAAPRRPAAPSRP